MSSMNSWGFTGDVEEDEETPEESEISKQIADLMESQRVFFIGDCWCKHLISPLFYVFLLSISLSLSNLNFVATYKVKKPYLSEDHRLKLCLTRVKSYSVCASITEEDVEKGIGEAEQREQAIQEEKMDKWQKRVKRRKKFNQRKEALAVRRKGLELEARNESEGDHNSI